MKSILILTFTAFLAFWQAPALAALPEVVIGTAQIVDGDTIIVKGTTIRLHGIDAPEAGQKCKNANGKSWRCGKAAIKAIAIMTVGAKVRCFGKGRDAYNRLIATCHLGQLEINKQLVRQGHAWAFVKYSSVYAETEKAARKAKIGIWQGDALPAWEYRAQRWNVAAQDAPEGCPIKGNISKRGRIYHTPWSRVYKRTKVSINKGERWFCSEREALDAGWRAPLWR